MDELLFFLFLSCLFFFLQMNTTGVKAYCNLYNRCMAELESDVPISCIQTIH